jgi:hypothetical protein
MGVPRSLALGAFIAGAALTYYVRERHARTGQGYFEIVRRLPAEAERLVTRSRERAGLALEEGRAAARARDEELTRQLQAARAPGS